MTQGHKHNAQNLFDEQESRGQKKLEDSNTDDCSGIGKPTSSQVKNAHAAGMGALERSDENQIEKEDEVNSEDTVY
jgi:hypothetical protein